ncbi:complex I NDUFA9 subunit family protein [Rhodovibrionaceae bacterium A322]
MTQGTVTVFGGSGFLGRYVVNRLARQGWNIRIAVRRPSRAKFLVPQGQVGQIIPVHCNIREKDQIEAVLKGSDAVVNLVGLLFEQGKQSFADVQFRGAETIAQVAASQGIEDFVQVSALGVSETAQASYARSKLAAEQAVRAAVPTARILRPSVVFGREDDFFNRFAKLMAFSPFLPLVGGGQTRFQPVYVDDVAAAVVTCLENQACAGQTYELGGPEVLTFKQLLELLMAQVERKRLLLPLPFGLASFEAWFLEKLPNPPLTRDQVTLLKQDNVLTGEHPGLADLGIAPTGLQTVLPTYLKRYRPGGLFEQGERV